MVDYSNLMDDCSHCSCYPDYNCCYCGEGGQNDESSSEDVRKFLHGESPDSSPDPATLHGAMSIHAPHGDTTMDSRQRRELDAYITRDDISEMDADDSPIEGIEDEDELDELSDDVDDDDLQDDEDDDDDLDDEDEDDE